MTAQPEARPREPDRDDELDSLREIKELMRRGFVRPIEAVPPLHAMAPRRQLADVNQQEYDDPRETK